MRQRVTETAILVQARLSGVRLAIVGGLVLWMAVVFVAYYAVHKPLPEDLAQGGAVWSLLRQGWSVTAILDTLMALGTVLWLLGLSLGIGTLLLEGILGEPPDGLLERGIFGTALGLGALSFAFLFLGMVAALTPLPAFLVLGLLSGFGLVGLRRLPWRRSRALVGPSDQAGQGGLVRSLQVLLLVMAPFIVTRALTPPTAWDSLVYHLAGPQRYIQAGRIIGGIDVPHFYFPSLVEQLFTAALLVQGDISARLMHLALAGVGAVALYGFLARREGPRAGWLALGVLVSAASLLSLATQTYVEWGLLAFGFLAFWALQEATERENIRWLALSGCLAGLVLGVKYTGVFLVAALAWLLVWRAAHRFSTGHPRAFPRWSHLLLWGGAVAAVASPWYIKNLMLTGNPVYPFLFGGWNWDAWKAAWFSRPGTGLITEPGRLLAAPWELTVLGVEGGAFYDVTLGPLFLGLLPLLVVARPKSSWAAAALLVVAIGYGAWLYGAAQSELLMQGRLLLPVLPFLAALLASGVAQTARLALPFLRIERTLGAAIVLVVALTLLRLTADWVADPPLPYLVGAESRGAYLERRLGNHYRALSFVNTGLPPDAKVLFLWEPRSYLCRSDCQPDALLYNWRYLLLRHRNPEAIFRALRAEGYTHILLYGGGLRFFSQPAQRGGRSLAPGGAGAV